MKKFYCSDAGFDCKAVVYAERDEEILSQAADHARVVHNTLVTAEMAEQLKTLIQEEV